MVKRAACCGVLPPALARRSPWRAALLAPLLALLLAACAGPLLPAPPATLQVPAQWRSEVGPQADAPALERQWWAGFGDLVLSAMVADALAQNADLRVARTRVAEFQARTVLAGAARLPTLDAQATPGRVRALNGAGQPFVSNVYQGSVQAAYELDVWGKLAKADEAALASYQAERASADAVALAIAANVASAYLNLRGLDAQLELAEATLLSRQRSQALARRAQEAGYSSRLELMQAQFEYAATAEQLPQLRRSIAEQENALAVLLGRSPGAIARGRPLADLPAPEVPAGLPSALLRRRPDVYRAEQNVMAQNASLAVARDQMLPSFKLTATGGVQNFNLGTLLDAPTALWNLTVGLAAPLYEGGRLRAQSAIAAAQRDAAVYAYENVVRGAFAETENGLDAVYRLKQQREWTVARRDAAAETLRIARNRHADGYASYLEELDAQRSLYSAEVGLLQLQTRRLVAAVNLYRALGGGWSGEDAAPATGG